MFLLSVFQTSHHVLMFLDLKKKLSLCPHCRNPWLITCLLYTSDAADDMQCVDLGGRRIIKKREGRRRDGHTRMTRPPGQVKKHTPHRFFQAEDGIRDVERSRGLGDVYKRQAYCKLVLKQKSTSILKISCFYCMQDNSVSVSYTHLTLPTICSV